MLEAEELGVEEIAEVGPWEHPQALEELVVVW